MNGFLTLILFIASRGANQGDIIAHWPMDAIEEDVVPDASGNGLDIRAMGEMPAGFIRTGAFERAAYFDNGRNWLEIGSAPALSLRDDFTISCAIYPLSVDGFRTILWKGDRTVTPEVINYYFDLRDGKVELKAKDAEGRWKVHGTGPVVKPGAWHFIVVSYSGGTVRIWVNGEECPVRTGESGKLDNGLLPNDGPLLIGAGANSQGIAYAFLGLIDEVRILHGPSDGPSGDDMAAWRESVAAYERRLALARLEDVLENIRNASRIALPAEEIALLDRLEARCTASAEGGLADIDKAVTGIQQGLDRLAYRGFCRSSLGDNPFLVIPLRTSDRVVKRPRFFEDIRDCEKEITLESARNEFEGFQLLITPGPQKTLIDVSVELSELKGGGARLDRNGLEWGWIRPIETEVPDIPVPFVGRIPDAIIEGSAPPPIAPYDFECLYVRLFVPPDAVPGDYTGTVNIKAGGETRELPLELRVYGITLPEETPLKMAFSFFEHFYEDWYGLKEVPRDTQRELYRFLLNYRIPPNDIYSSRTTYPDLDHLKRERERITFFTYSTGLPNPGTGTPERVEESIGRIEEVYAALAQENLLDGAYFYCFDELAYNSDRIPEARRFVHALRERIPSIRVMQTSFPEESIRDLFNVWCPLIHHFERPGDRQLLEELRAQGNEIWWYMADAPNHPFPNLFLDYPPFDARILGVLSFMYDVEGVLYWSINREWKTNLEAEPRWPEGDWKAHIYHLNQGTRKFKNGMGNLVYPGPDGQLYPSLRLENLRDGIEDHCYLTLLKEFADSAYAEGHAALAARARALLDVPSSVAAAASDYNSEPAPLLEYRHHIAEFLSEVSESPAAAPNAF